MCNQVYKHQQTFKQAMNFVFKHYWMNVVLFVSWYFVPHPNRIPVCPPVQQVSTFTTGVATRMWSQRPWLVTPKNSSYKPRTSTVYTTRVENFDVNFRRLMACTANNLPIHWYHYEYASTGCSMQGMSTTTSDKLKWREVLFGSKFYTANVSAWKTKEEVGTLKPHSKLTTHKKPNKLPDTCIEKNEYGRCKYWKYIRIQKQETDVTEKTLVFFALLQMPFWIVMFRTFCRN